MEEHVLISSKLVVQRWVLEDDAERLADSVRLFDRIHSIDPYRTRSRMQQSRQHFDSGRLAGAIRSEKRKNASIFHIK